MSLATPGVSGVWSSAMLPEPLPSARGPLPRWLSSRLLRAASWVGSVLMLALAIALLHRYLSAVAWQDVSAALTGLPSARILGALGATALSLTMLASFDVLAAHSVARSRVSTGLAAFAGATAHALSSTLGFHALTGGAVRYHVYASAGLGAGDIARIISLASIGVGLGYAVLGASSLSLGPALLGAGGRIAGFALIATLAGLLLWLARRPRRLHLHHWTLALPGARLTAAQMVIGGIEMSAAIGVMYLLLPAAVAPPFVDFVPLYLAAVLAGIVSHAPGGLGIFEAILLSGFSATARADVLAALLCYRLIYNLLPFTLAAAALATFEARRKLQASADA